MTALVLGTASLHVGLRPETTGDDAVSRAIFAATRQEELAWLPWDGGQKAAWVTQQHRAQQQAYRTAYPHGRFDIVLVNDDVAGRLYVGEDATALYVIDIALMPAWRNRGIGAWLLTAVLDSAAATGRVVELHVAAGNPAVGLYRRLGFREVDQHGMHFHMRATPSPAVSFS